MPMIDARGVTKSYRRGGEVLEVLQHVSFSVEPGEFLALMGPSGSGKTTLLNLLGGLDTPDGGTLTIDGQDMSTKIDLSAWRAATVGFVFQTFNLIPVLTALGNVELPLLLTNLSRGERRERAELALELVDLADRGRHLPSQLSGGQEQRVAIARSIVTDPMFLLADEPTGDLDRTSATQILELLTRLNQEENKTILMVTHDPFAADYASRQIRLDKGRVSEAP